MQKNKNKMAVRINTVADLAAVYGGGVISNDRGSGAGGPKWISDDDLKDPDIGEAKIAMVSRDEDREAWELAEYAADGFGLPAVTLVGVQSVDLDPNNPYMGLSYEVIYAV